ncbi:uncharacterized protein V1516DRAFT_270397 [Lipomyces oligophaga]|uniref:uncharacterized protein n=1 Tax=Lipomyces oligophaga TaxID=45792 RepID=UPI0034CE9E56
MADETIHKGVEQPASSSRELSDGTELVRNSTSNSAIPASISFKDPRAGIKVSLALNKSLSADLTDVLAAQGVSWAVRTALKYAPVTVSLDYSFSEELDAIILNINQYLPAGVTSTEYRIVDNTERAVVSPVFGPVIGYSKYIPVSEIDEKFAFLAKGWDQDTIGNGVIFAHARGDPTQPNGLEWESYQAIGFADVIVDDGIIERKYVSRLHFTSPKLKEPLEKRIVYDFVKEGL